MGVDKKSAGSAGPERIGFEVGRVGNFLYDLLQALCWVKVPLFYIIQWQMDASFFSVFSKVVLRELIMHRVERKEPGI